MQDLISIHTSKKKKDHDILWPNGEYVGLQADKNDKKTEVESTSELPIIAIPPGPTPAFTELNHTTDASEENVKV